MNRRTSATLLAILAAALYAINIPLSKVLLNHVAPGMMAALLYLGAGLGLTAYSGVRRLSGYPAAKNALTRKELPYTIAMVLLDVAAPILLMLGIQRTASANVSLINNFEIVFTALVARLLFREAISRKLWLGIALITLAGVLLGLEDGSRVSLNKGALFVLGACLCWGFENNCTRRLSQKSSVEIVMIKGVFSGLGSLIVAFLLGESLPAPGDLAVVLALGFVSYGLSINFYILAQRELGAARTSAYYSVAPFLGAAFSLAILGERPGARFFAAAAIMAAATALVAWDGAAEVKGGGERENPAR